MKTVISLSLIITGLAFSSTAFAAISMDNGKKIFKAHCMQCHGLTGEANTKVAKMLSTPPANFDDPNYKDSRGKKLATYSDEELASKIKYGSKGTSMPSFKSKLSDDDIKDVVEYVRDFAKR